MLWLAGLMGMMVLGSVAVFGTQDSGDDPDDEALPDNDGMTDPVAAGGAEWLPGGELPSQGARTDAELDKELAGDATAHPEALADAAPPRWSGAFPEADPQETIDEVLDDGRGEAGPWHAGADAQGEHLVIVWDDSDGAELPLLGLRISDTPGMTDILLDDVPVATLPEADVPPLDSIVLISESAAAGLPV